MNILFFLRQSRIDKKGKVPIYFRITIDGERLEPPRHTGVRVNRKLWANERIKGGQSDNLLLDAIEYQLKTIHASEVAKGKTPTVRSIMAVFDGVADIRLDALAEKFFEYCYTHLVDNPKIDKVERLSKVTVETYSYKFNHILSYYSSIKKDVPVASALNAVEMSKIVDWLRIESDVDLQRSTIARVVTVARKIIKYGYNCGILESNALKDFVYTRGEDKTPINLSLAEVQKVLVCPYSDSLQKAADLFLLQCFTGMELKDIYYFTAENIKTIDGKEYIVYHRQKNGNKATIPLNEGALMLIKKYGFDWPEIKLDAYNDKLKRVGDKAGVSVDLTMRIGRKTFHNIKSNTELYSPAAVAVMMGHSKIETGRHYSRPNMETIVNEVNLRKDR